MMMPFGKYGPRGLRLDLDDVPASYLMWLWEQNVDHPSVRRYIEDNMEGIKKNIADGDGDL